MPQRIQRRYPEEAARHEGRDLDSWGEGLVHGVAEEWEDDRPGLEVELRQWAELAFQEEGT